MSTSFTKRLLFTRPARRAIAGVARLLASLKPKNGDLEGDAGAEAEFRDWLQGLQAPTVVELGTRRTETGIPTVRRHWAGADATYIAADFMAGPDVDVVADAERLSETFAAGSVDAVIACSVFEHIQRPWLAAAEIGKVLKPGGRVYVQTHFAFPLHAYPHDYWRFSREALETLFAEDHGFVKRTSFYQFPCSILSEQDPVGIGLKSYLNVGIVAEKGAR
ncbi:methyltransferase domain-containing protein [Microvirga massiliensis]|uniref:methyltransferase domain-containing protein n=1 Tax=Microvirga massiliensis TaxID=1033741 RepID=UPI0006613C78|nr:class I SAM-dependent methyltransferase [Microvirga massiliensis]